MKKSTTTRREEKNHPRSQRPTTAPTQMRSFETLRIPINEIDTSKNVRKTVKIEDYQKLKNSIASEGLLNPVLVMRNFSGAKKNFRCISGHTRLSIIAELGHDTCPCTIIPNNDVTNARYLATIENLRRCDLNTIDKADAYAAIRTDLNLSISALARKLDCSRQYATCMLNIAEWPHEIKQLCLDKGYPVKTLFRYARKKLLPEDTEKMISEFKKIGPKNKSAKIPAVTKSFCDKSSVSEEMALLLSRLEKSLARTEAKDAQIALRYVQYRLKLSSETQYS